MDNHEFVFLFLLVIVIYLIFTSRGTGPLFKGLLITATGAMIYFGYKLYGDRLKGTQAESFVLPPHPAVLVEPSSVPDDSISDDIELSQYGNLSNTAIDYMGQTDVKNLSFPKSDAIDNSDIFETVFSGAAMYTPAEAYSRDYYNVKDREWYTKHFQKPEDLYTSPEYTIPFNPGGTDADSALTRRQLTRGEMNKKAIDGAVRATRALNERIYTHELAENYERQWWTHEGDGVMGGAEVEFE